MALAYSFCCSTERKDSETEAIKDIIADSITVEKMMQLYSLLDQYKKGRVWMDIYCQVDWNNGCRGIWRIWITTWSMLMELKAVTEALCYHREKQHKRATCIIVSDSMSIFQNIQKENLYMAWMSSVSGSCLRRLILVFYPIHADVNNERADNLTEKAIIDNNHTLDPATVIQCVTQQLVNFRPESTSYTLSFWKTRGFSSEVQLVIEGGVGCGAFLPARFLTTPLNIEQVNWRSSVND